MSQVTSIGRTTIHYDESVEKCLRFFRDNWSTQKVIDLFQNARRVDNAKSYFKIDENDARGEYVLEHKGGDNFHLSWKYF